MTSTSLKFGPLDAYDPKGNTAVFDLSIRPQLPDGKGGLIQPALTMRNATQGNRSYFNAVAKRNAKTGAARRIAQMKVDADMVEQNRRQDRELFPKFVVIGWAGIVDSDGAEVPFSVDDCTAFLASLPDWMMDEVRTFAAIAANFLPEDEPTEDDIRETAGN